MYKQNIASNTSLKVNESVDGETIENKIERIINNNEPITDGAPSIYTERKEGVMAGYNIRSDRFEIAIEATDKLTAQRIAKRADNLAQRDTEKGGEIGKPETTQGTSE